MNNIQKKRLGYIAVVAVGIALATSLILYALRQNINVFLTPTQLLNTTLTSDNHIRLGGMVKPHSIVRDKNTLTIQFIVTDYKHDTIVRYTGVPPDLFREGKGVIAEGTLNAQGVLMATQILAKHDENYMPKNVYQAMRKEAEGS